MAAASNSGLETFLSSEDISKGRRWSPELADSLAKTNFAILCMTPENLTSNWIHFEAGAVSKNPGVAHVSALLLDVKVSDLVDPLAQFQHTPPSREEVWKLVLSVNAAMEAGRQTPGDVLQWSFDQAWPDFEKLVVQAQDTLRQSATPAPPERKPQELLEEILVLLRDQQREHTLMGRFAPTLTPEQEAAVLGNPNSVFRSLVPRMSLLDSVSEPPLPLRESPPTNPKK